MIFLSGTIRGICRFTLTLAFCLLSTAPISKSLGETVSYNQDLEDRLQNLTTRILLTKTNSENLRTPTTPIKSIAELQQALQFFTLTQPELNSENSQQVIQQAKILLSFNATGVIENVLQKYDASGEERLAAQLRFLLAQHFSQQELWDNALSELDKVDPNIHLSKAQTDEAYIIVANGLQHKKQHRAAIPFYEKITSDSPHYRTAQIDLATVYLRQDWWTDAQLAIKNAIMEDQTSNDEMNNRCYTILGYSQIQQGFYRDARSSFHHVKIHSKYADRALLGLGMSALNQEEFSSALNAFRLLRDKEDSNSITDQAYLMVPYTLSLMKQQQLATTAFNEAITYYETITSGNSAIAKKITAHSDLTLQDQKWLRLSTNQLEKISMFKKRLDMLSLLHSLSTNSKDINEITHLETAITNAYFAQLLDWVSAKNSVINSYISQSRYGLAKLYDASES